ncbi:hypothetical protein BCR35DRAFT_27733 [Leucosporidium creatinivorum]|uniref:Zn(2)-C6 fungal-type domain-containing protein n=1 Tax=Leucosporidium creatinivorum TaxID=106004 RepID=A0A1Y2CKN4_9BASI|nr:hypothetical protein BCR35DRAFT_27733 [Leucosporidium creatinivorum]
MGLKSCAECRGRRISCVELTAEGCKTCIRRDVRCSGRPPPETKVHRRAPRGSKMAEVKAAFAANGASTSPPDSQVVRTSATPLDVSSITSPASRLLTFELQAALHHHLVENARSIAKQTIPGTHLDPLAYQVDNYYWKRYTMLSLEFKSSDVQYYNLPALPADGLERIPPVFSEHEATSDLVHACFDAFGSRWSDHSAIVGASSSLEDRGLSREKPARALIDRAFLIAESSGVLDLSKATLLHARAAGFLLHTANVVAPDHPLIPSLIASIHDLRTRARAKPEVVAAEDRWDWQYYSQLLPETSLLDARFAIRSNTACTLSDEYLANSHAWTPGLALKSVQYLASLATCPWSEADANAEVLYVHLCSANLYLLRALALLRQQGLHQPPMFLFSSFSHLADVAEKLDAFFEAKRVQIISTRTLLEGGWLDLLNGQRREMLPFVSFVCDAIQGIARVNEAWEKSDLRLEVSSRFERLLLRTLKRLMELPSFLHLEDMARLVEVAPLFAEMPASDAWLPLVIRATQPSSELYYIGFDLDDLSRLRAGLKKLAGLYASVSQQSQRLEMLLLLESFSKPPLLAPRLIPEGGEDDLAQTMVHDAVDAMLT